MPKFDDAENYSLNFTSDLPNEAGGIPIGLYLCWAADAGLLHDALKREIDTRRARGQTSADLLFGLVDGKLTSEEFNEEGAAFTSDYYGSGYLTDYQRCFRLGEASVDALCAVADTAASLVRLKPHLNERLIAWRATPRVKPIPPMSAGELFEWLKDRLLPELRADGFEDLKPRRHEFEVRRRVGSIEQQLLFMVYESGGLTVAKFMFFLGAERLRKVGLALLGASGADAVVPPIFTAPVRQSPEVQGDEFSLSEGLFGLVPYYQRIPDGREQVAQITLAHYLEWVRPTLNGLDSIARLAELIHCKGQRLKLSNGSGMPAPALVARVVLLSAYGDHLRGPDGEELLHQLRQQVRRPNSAWPETLLTREALDQVIARIQQPGVVEQVRIALDAA